MVNARSSNARVDIEVVYKNSSAGEAREAVNSNSNNLIYLSVCSGKYTLLVGVLVNPI